MKTESGETVYGPDSYYEPPEGTKRPEVKRAIGIIFTRMSLGLGNALIKHDINGNEVNRIVSLNREAEKEVIAYTNQLEHERNEAIREIGEISRAYGLQSAELTALKAENEKALDRVEKAEEFAHKLLNWSKAYPEKIFPEPTADQVDEVCKTLGFRLDRIAAMILRNYTNPWGKVAEAFLSSLTETKED